MTDTISNGLSGVGGVAFESLPQQGVVLDRTGEIVLANGAWRRSPLYRDELGVGANYLAVCSGVGEGPDQDEAWAAASVIRSVLAERESLGEVEYRCAPPGFERWFRMSVVGVGSGADRLAVMTHTPITRERFSERRLEELLADHEKLSLVARLTHNGVLITDRLGRIEWANEAFSRLCGWPTREVIGRKPGEFLRGPGTDPATVEMMRRKVRAGEAFACEVLNYSRDGGSYWVSLDVQPVQSVEGRVTGFVAVQADVTDRRRASEELTRSKSFLQNVLDTTPAAIFTLRPEWEESGGERRVRDLVYTSVNRETERIAGAPAMSMIGRGICERFPHARRVGLFDALKRVAETGDPYAADVRYSGDGIDGWYRFHVTGDASGLTAVAQEVTEQKRDEERLRAHEQLLKAVLDTSPGAVLVLDAVRDEVGAVVDLRYVLANEPAGRLLNRPTAELLGRRVTEVFPGVARTGLMPSFARVVETGEPLDELLWYDADGVRGWFALHATRLNDGVSLTLFDVTSERESTRATALQAQVLTQAGEAVFSTDLDGVVRTWNPGAEELFGTPASVALGRGLGAVLARGDRAGSRGDLASALVEAVAEQRRLEDELEFGSGVGRGVAIARVSPLVGPGDEPQGMVGVVSDVTRLRELESELRQTQKLDALGRLASGVAHEFNNLLTAMYGFAEHALGRMSGNDGARSSMRQLMETIEQSSRLTRSLLVMSRRTSGERTVIDLRRAVHATLELVRRGAAGSATVLEGPGLASGEPIPVRADQGMVQQVLLNLTLNARDALAGRAGEIVVDVDVEDRGPRGVWALLTVRDDGVGMDEETRRRACEPFFTTKAREAGTGLGLSISEGIVTDHGGRLEIDSTPGEGTTMRVWLPAALADDALGVSCGAALADAEASGPGPPRDEGEGPEAGAGRAVIVEDDPMVRGLLASMLERLGWSASFTDAGRGAPGTGEAELVVTSCRAAVADGGLVERARANGAGVVLVREAEEGPGVAAPDGSPGVAFVDKPFGAAELARAVERAVSGVAPGAAEGNGRVVVRRGGAQRTESSLEDTR